MEALKFTYILQISITINFSATKNIDLSLISMISDMTLPDA